MTGPSLAALLADAAERLEGAVGVPTGQGTDLYLDDVRVRVARADAAEFRLRDEVGAAALRTPNVTASVRGVGWVRFAPRHLDGHARDRALAWLESAWRRADAELAGLADDDVDDGADEDDPADLEDDED